MTPRMTRLTAELEFVYQEGKSEVVFTDQLLEGWAWCSRNTGLPRLSTKCSLGGLAKASNEETALDARARAMNLNDAQFAAIDRAVAHLPKSLRKVTWVEYQTHATQHAKAVRLHLARADYRERLIAARWAVYIALLPEVEVWRSLAGGG